MHIIGITGTLGAGKGTIVDYLIKEKSYRHFSARDYISKEIKKRGLPVNRDNMTMVANDLRAKNSPSFVIEELFKEAKQHGKNAVIESIRTPGEIAFLRKNPDFILLAVNAEPKIRYKRITQRQSSTDQISYQKFLSDEEREMHNTDPNKQNLSACIELADYKIKNNGSMEELHNKIEKILNNL